MHNPNNKECEMGRPDWDRWGSKPCSCPDDSTQESWEEELKFEVMEDYLREAELTQFAKNTAEHMERMRHHWDKLRDFIRTAIETAIKEKDDECKKILNNGRQMYELGKKEERERNAALRAKELGEIRAEMETLSGNLDYHMGVEDCVSILDELIEKP
jgi:hypothetical protein